MQVSPLDKVHYKEEISHHVPKAVADDNTKMEKAVKYAAKKDIKVYNHTFLESA
jgi:hypothetical protein